MQKLSFDVVVVGAGSGGLTASVGLAKTGKKVLLIEREHMGGECTNSGCIPSKALLHHAKSYHQAMTITSGTPESEAYRTRAFSYVREKIAAVLAEETPEHFSALGITVIHGEAKFTGKHTIAVAGVTYTFKKAIIATGSMPRSLSIPGLGTDHILTNQNFFTQTTIPKDILIIGAGPIGLELGQALALLGSTVTIVDNGDRLARLEDEAISPIITKAFTNLGITVLHNAAVTKVENETAYITIADNPVERQVSFDRVLIAIGRVPNLPSGLDAAHIISSAYGIEVNHNWQTSNKNVYALGDVAARLKFTHVADDTGRQVVAHIVSHGLFTVKQKQVPKVTYTEPEMAQVGLSWPEALALYGQDKLHRIEVPFTANDRARTDDNTDGLLIVIAKRLSGKIVGAHIVGARAGELIGSMTLAMEHNLSLYQLRSTIFAYPTYSLILKKAGDYFLAKQVASLKTDLGNLALAIAPKLFFALLWIGLLLTVYSYQQTFGLTASELSLTLFTAITASPIAPLLYILVYTIRPITFFPGTALTILSGVFFGLWGILYTIIGANLSAALAYVVGRFFSQRSTTPATSAVGRLIEAGRQNPFLSILTMRLTFMPFDVVNYGAGLLKFPFLPYMSATILGTILGITTFVAIGASLSVEGFIENGISGAAIDSTFILLSVGVFLLSLGISKLIKK